MNSNLFTNSKNLLTVGFIGLLVALLAFSFSLWQTPSYKSTVKLLAVFNQSNIDTYTASKTANYITGIMGEVVYSDSFINSVYNNDSNLADSLGQGSEMRQKNWKKIVKTQVLDNKGIIIIDAYGDDKTQTNQLAASIGSVIISQHGLYDGSQDRVTIRMIDTPSVYESWAGTKILTDTGLGLIAGLLIGLTLIVIFPNHRLFEFKRQEKITYNYSATPQQPAPMIPAPQAVEVPEPKPAEEKMSSAIADILYDQDEDSPNRVSNPWLNQYYAENMTDQSGQN